jgi:hypothetical protein
MSRGPQTFRKTDVTKAVLAVVAAGLPVARVEISPGRIIIIVAGGPEQGQDAGAEVNEWDAVK